MGAGIKRIVRDSVMTMASRARVSGNGSGYRVAVLCYHSVHPSSPTASVSGDGFRRHLEWLSDNCDIVAFDQVKARADATGRERPVVAITFDDAFADNYEHAWPVLTEFGMPATFFITTGLVERQPAVVARFARLLDVSRSVIVPLSWPQIIEMRESGMEIGAHSVTHPNLAYTDVDSARWEIATSRDVLEQVLGVKIISFAYPFGKPKHNFTSRTVELVREAGFMNAGAIHCRTMRANEDPLRVPRIPINSDSVEALRAVVSGGEDMLGVWQERAPAWLSHAVSPERSHRREHSLRSGAIEPKP
jgi:peptidoglycan/xylan/chitin deacetylase (PgdA/CDA1 family)